MKQLTFVLFVTISFSLIAISLSSRNLAYGDESNSTIPQWFRDNASLWLSGNMNDQQFMQAIHQLVTNISYSQDRQVNQTT
ncbi:MAG: hypothetical protein ACREBB_06605, partial [Nitrosotalea sp.]